MQLRRQHSKATLTLALLIIAAVTALAYYPGMSAGFYFDDKSNLLGVSALQWDELSWPAVSGALHDAHLTSRPVANISMALNHLGSGLDPAPYHWTNLAIHIAVGLSLFWVILLFQRHHGAGPGDHNFALLAVLLFLIHPLNIQATTYMVQRMTSLATLFVLLGLGSYINGRYLSDAVSRRVWLNLAGICLLLAASSKETGFLLIPLLLLYEICFNREALRNAYRRTVAHIGTPVLIFGCSLLLLFLVWLGWTFTGDVIYWTGEMPTRDFSAIERVLTQGRVQFFYLSLLLWPTPSRLNLDHAFTVSRSLVEPVTTLLALLLIAAAVVIAVRSMRARPNVAFPLLAYMLLHSIEAGPFNLELVFEHRMYLPMTMIALLIGLNLRPSSAKHMVSTYAVLLVIGVLLAVSTYQRNLVWGNEIDFHTDVAQKSPLKFRPQYNLGTVLGKNGALGEAKSALERAIRIRPENSLAHNQLANVYFLTNQPRLAEQHYRRAVEYDPENAEALFNLSRILMSQGRHVEQRTFLERFVQVAPPYLEEQKQWALRQLGR
jgi:tetratricopeptide (TPR) repeat protein